jgi:hypothetical protein
MGLFRRQSHEHVNERVVPTMAEAMVEAQAFQHEAEQFRDAIRMVRGDIAGMLDEIDLYVKARQELEEATRERTDP